MASDETRILMLHRVLPDEAAAFGLPSCYRLRGTALTQGELCEVLDASGPILPLEAIEEALAEHRHPPPGAVVTFDDGYREHLDVVSPLLVERGARATFYVSTGLHGAGRRVSIVDAWYWLLDHAEYPDAALRLPDGELFRCRVDTVEGKASWVTGRPKEALLRAGADNQMALLDALGATVRCALPVDLATRLYLRPDEWRALHRDGMRVGAHGATHPRLTLLEDAALAEEVNGSVAVLGAFAAPISFAYPDGAYDQRVVEHVRRAGATSAVTCERGAVRRDTDLLRLPRWFVRPVETLSRSAFP